VSDRQDFLQSELIISEFTAALLTAGLAQLVMDG
jgi:hypothetical protein